MSSTPLTGVRGWLLFLCVVLTILNPLALLFWVFELGHLVTLLQTRYPAYAQAVLAQQCLFGALAVLSVRAGLQLWRVQPEAPRTAKNFLVAYLVVFLVSAFLPYVSPFPKPLRAALIETSAVSALRTLAFCAVWHLYLTRSRRVQNTYPPRCVTSMRF